MKTGHQILVDNVIVPYTVRRSSRRKKTYEIKISGGSVLVSVPARMRDRDIQELVERKGSWILDKLNGSSDNVPSLRYETGEVVPLFGQGLVLEVVESSVRPSEVRIEGRHLHVQVASGLAGEKKREAVHSALVGWYKLQAMQFLEKSVAEWLPRMGRAQMPRVLVREQRRRWGSCSADGTLRFSWRLAMVRPELVESVVVHELAHLDVMNHSKAFWEVVERVMPDAKERSKQLNSEGRCLPL